MSTDNNTLGLSLEQILADISNDETLTKTAGVVETSAAEDLQALLTATDDNKPQSQEDTSTMTKQAQAQTTGNLIADSILASLNGAGSIEKVANEVIKETDALVKDDDAKVKSSPLEGNTVTETARALLQRGVAEGDAAPVEGDQRNEAEAEGGADVENDAIALQKLASESMMTFVNEGYSFDDARELVKQACDVLASQHVEIEKAAAVNALIAQGVDFEDACILVKQAADEMYGQEDFSQSSDLEKAAAVDELVQTHGFSYDDAVAAISDIVNGQA